jgi:glutaredoxin
MDHVEGENKGNVMLYAISTCQWCRKTKKLLKDMNVSYDYVDMDRISKNKKEKIEEKVKECNPKLSYPTLKINGKCVTGFKDDEIREALK